MNIASAQPLYGVELLDKHRSSQVVVVRGEDARGAAQRLFKEAGVGADKLVVIGWPGKVEDVDWAPLTDRDLCFWLAGQQSTAIVEIARRLKIESRPDRKVKVVRHPAGVAADELIAHMKSSVSADEFFGADDDQGASQSLDADSRDAVSPSIDNARCLADEFAEPDADLLQARAMADLAGKAEQTPSKKASSTAAARSANAIAMSALGVAQGHVRVTPSIKSMD